jgi:LL-diaminopimelate aminotransferase
MAAVRWLVQFSSRLLRIANQTMSDPYFQQLFAERIGGVNYGKGTEIYKFEKIKRAKRKALADHPNRSLVDFGIGENDSMAPETIRRKLAEEANQPANRGYMDNGNQNFKDAVARFMQRNFGVTLDAKTQVNHSIGSKPALAMIPACFINPGDVTLMTVPGYPVAGTHTRYYGGTVFRLPLLAENQFYPDFKSIPADVWPKVKLLVINYPNSPTGKTASKEFYAQVVALAKEKQFVVVQDAAHSLLSYDQPPSSFLQTPGAMDVGVEVHSLSKGFDMIGWRIGWVCGAERIVQAFADVKDNSDSGQFGAIQNAAAAALDDDAIHARTRTKYKRRLEKLVAMLSRCGFKCQMPGGTYFLYTRAPSGLKDGTKFANAEEASQFLITQLSIVTVPWDDAGPFLRFSVTYEAETEAAEDALMAAAEDRLKGCGVQFS